MFERDFVDRDREFQRRHAAKQRVEDDLKLGAGKLLADALMPAVPECDMLARTRPMQVQPIGLAEFLRVPVRGRVVDDDAFAGTDDNACGHTIMRELAKVLGAGHHVVAIPGGDQNSLNLQNRVKGALDEATNYPNIAVQGVYYSKEVPQDAAVEVEQVQAILHAHRFHLLQRL